MRDVSLMSRLQLRAICLMLRVPAFCAAEAYGKKGKIEAQHLAFELTELFASGELTPQDMDGIMYEMHKAYFKYREQKREKERIMNL